MKPVAILSLALFVLGVSATAILDASNSWDIGNALSPRQENNPDQDANVPTNEQGEPLPAPAPAPPQVSEEDMDLARLILLNLVTPATVVEYEDADCGRGCYNKCGSSTSAKEIQSCQIGCGICCATRGKSRCAACSSDYYCREMQRYRTCYVYKFPDRSGQPIKKCAEWKTGEPPH